MRDRRRARVAHVVNAVFDPKALDSFDQRLGRPGTVVRAVCAVTQTGRTSVGTPSPAVAA